MTNLALEKKLDFRDTLLYVAARNNNRSVVEYLVDECGYVD